MLFCSGYRVVRKDCAPRELWMEWGKGVGKEGAKGKKCSKRRQKWREE